MEEFVANQIRYGLKYLPANLAKSFVLPRRSAETKALRDRGFLCGVCHPNENYQQIKEANIGWVRFDIPFPFAADGQESESYRQFKARAQGYVDRGIKVMAVTPYPEDYIAAGMDPRTPEGEEKVRRTARFLIKDLQKYVGALQITNEMGLPRFTLPLTLPEAAAFIGMQMEEMAPLRGDILIGYNSAGPEAQLHALMKPYAAYFDYVGIDIYLGCFDGYPGFMWVFDALLRYLWAFTHKPVIIQEFGYISGGAPKTKAEKREILRGYGVEREEEASTAIEDFIGRLPEAFRQHVKHDANNDPARYFDLIFRSDFKQHLYKEMTPTTVIPGYPHTPEGQAKFFADSIDKLYRTPYVLGAFIYCYTDAERCYVCGQEDCPVETRWGLVDRAGNPKPAYYAVQKQFGRIRFLTNVERYSK